MHLEHQLFVQVVFRQGRLANGVSRPFFQVFHSGFCYYRSRSLVFVA